MLKILMPWYCLLCQLPEIYGQARTELMRELGFDKPALFDGMQFVVHEVGLKYHSPAVLDDQIRVTAELHKATRVTFEAQQVYRGEELLVEAVSGWPASMLRASVPKPCQRICLKL